MTDRLGSGVLILNGSGGVVQQREFEPFGGILSQSYPTESNPRLFTGQRMVGTTGLYDFKARWYDPEVGRFLSVDPVLPDLDDPQTHNAYSYVNNDPVNLVDPDGRYGIDVIAFIGTIIYWSLITYSVVDTALNIYSWASAEPSPNAPLPTGISVPDVLLAAQGAVEVAQQATKSAPGQSRAASRADTSQSAAWVSAGAAEGVLRAPIPGWAKLVALIAVTLYEVGQVLMQEGGDTPPGEEEVPDNSDIEAMDEAERQREAQREERQRRHRERRHLEDPADVQDDIDDILREYPDQEVGKQREKIDRILRDAAKRQRGDQ